MTLLETKADADKKFNIIITANEVLEQYDCSISVKPSISNNPPLQNSILLI